MEKNKTNAASGIEKERELTAEELEKVLGGAMDTQQMGEKPRHHQHWLGLKTKTE